MNTQEFEDVLKALGYYHDAFTVAPQTTHFRQKLHVCGVATLTEPSHQHKEWETLSSRDRPLCDVLNIKNVGLRCGCP